MVRRTGVGAEVLLCEFERLRGVMRKRHKPISWAAKRECNVKRANEASPRRRKLQVPLLKTPRYRSGDRRRRLPVPQTGHSKNEDGVTDANGYSRFADAVAKRFGRK
jgi:hypothetical protein